jgi:hypothetical protein
MHALAVDHGRCVCTVRGGGRGWVDQNDQVRKNVEEKMLAQTHFLTSPPGRQKKIFLGDRPRFARQIGRWPHWDPAANLAREPHCMAHVRIGPKLCQIVVLIMGYPNMQLPFRNVHACRRGRPWEVRVHCARRWHGWETGEPETGELPSQSKPANFPVSQTGERPSQPKPANEPDDQHDMAMHLAVCVAHSSGLMCDHVLNYITV